MADEKQIIPPARPKVEPIARPTESLWSHHIAPSWNKGGEIQTNEDVYRLRNTAWRNLHNEINQFGVEHQGDGPPIDHPLYLRLQDLRLRENDVWRNSLGTWNSMNVPAHKAQLTERDISELIESATFIHMPWRSMIPDKEGKYSIKFPSYPGVGEPTEPLYFNPKEFPFKWDENKSNFRPLTRTNQLYFSTGAELQQTMRVFDYIAVDPWKSSSLDELSSMYNKLPSTLENGKVITPDMMVNPRMFTRMFSLVDAAEGEGQAVLETTGIRAPKQGDLELMPITSFDEEGFTVDLQALSGREDQDKLESIRELWTDFTGDKEFGDNLNYHSLRRYIATAVARERYESLSEDDKQQIKDVGALLANFQDDADIRTDSKGLPVNEYWWADSDARALQSSFVGAQASQLTNIELPGEYAHNDPEGGREKSYWYKQIDKLAVEMEQRLQKMSGLSAVAADGVRAEGHWFVPFVAEASNKMGLSLDDPADLEVILDLYEDFLQIKIEAKRSGLKVGPYDETARPRHFTGDSITHVNKFGVPRAASDTFNMFGKTDPNVTYSYTSDYNPEIRRIRAFLKGAENYWMRQHDRNPLADIKAELGVAPEKWNLPKFNIGPEKWKPVYEAVKGEKVPRETISASFAPDKLPRVKKPTGKEEELKRAELTKKIPEADTDKSGDVSDKEYAEWASGETVEGKGVAGDPEQKAARDFLRQREMPKEDKWKGTARQPKTPAKPVPKILKKK